LTPIRQRNPARRAQYEFGIESLLNPLQLHAYGGLCPSETFGCLAHRAGLGDRNEHPEQPKIEINIHKLSLYRINNYKTTRGKLVLAIWPRHSKEPTCRPTNKNSKPAVSSGPNCPDRICLSHRQRKSAKSCMSRGKSRKSPVTSPMWDRSAARSISVQRCSAPGSARRTSS